jgi:hypothetical protein
MALPPVVHLNEFASGEFFELETRGAGTYEQVGEIRGNSILSSIFIESIDPGATLKINYYDSTTGGDIGERFDLVGHPLIDDTVPVLTTLRILVTRIHHRVVAEAIVTGGNIKFSLYATVVSSTASDLDQSLVYNEQIANLLTDKGLVAAGYDEGTGKFYFLPIDNGAVKVTGTVVAGGVTTPLNTTIMTDPTPSTETSFSLVGVKRYRMTNRGNAILRYAFASGGTSTNYATLYPNGTVEELDIISPAVTIYIQSPSPSQRIEVVSWN